MGEMTAIILADAVGRMERLWCAHCGCITDHLIRHAQRSRHYPTRNGVQPIIVNAMCIDCDRGGEYIFSERSLQQGRGL